MVGLIWLNIVAYMEVNLASHEPPKQFTSLRSPCLILSSDEVKLEKKKTPYTWKKLFFLEFEAISGHQTPRMDMLS